ncbi:MAG: ABC transporter [Pseudomonadota bacterium]
MSSNRPLPIHLALSELRHEWQAALCFVAALIGVLAPLMILLALKNGVIGALVDGLVEDPRNRQIIAVGSGAHTPETIAELAEREDVAFAMPAPRSINTQADAVRNADRRGIERGVQLVPSKAGDPLIPQGAVTRGAVFVSQSLAKQLSFEPGSSAQLVVEREIDGRLERVRPTFTVSGIVPEALFEKPALFMDLSDLMDIERFRDDKTLTPETWQDPRPAPETYASFRLYAESLSDLDPLQDALAEMGIRSRPWAENAALLVGFQRSLNILYAAIAAVAVLGFWAAMSANLRAMVERQRISFSLLGLMGMAPRARSLMPLTQSVVLVLGGIVLTTALVMPVIWGVNLTFGTDERPTIAHLGLSDVALFFILGGLTACTATLWALRALSDISPDEVLRHA